MEGGDERGFDPAEELFHPLAHFASRLVGEGDRQDLPWADPQFPDQPGDAVNDDPGLARAGACQDQQRPRAVLYRLFLRRIEVFQNIHVCSVLPFCR